MDDNKTVWQRLDTALTNALEETDITVTPNQKIQMTKTLHTYVVAEREDSRRMK